MKRLIYLFSIIFVVLQSCSSGDSSSEKNNTDNTLLIRKWYRISNTTGGRTYYNQPCSNGNRDYVEFTNPNIYNTYNISGTFNCNYIIEGPFNWSRSGDVITFYYNGTKISTAVISELTATTLKFVETEEGEANSRLNVFSSF